MLQFVGISISKSCECHDYDSHVMQVKKQEDRNGKLQGHLVMLREILVTMFKEVPLPGKLFFAVFFSCVNTFTSYQDCIYSTPDLIMIANTCTL